MAQYGRRAAPTCGRGRDPLCAHALVRRRFCPRLRV